MCDFIGRNTLSSRLCKTSSHLPALKENCQFVPGCQGRLQQLHFQQKPGFVIAKVIPCPSRSLPVPGCRLREAPQALTSCLPWYKRSTLFLSPWPFLPGQGFQLRHDPVFSLSHTLIFNVQQQVPFRFLLLSFLFRSFPICNLCHFLHRRHFMIFSFIVRVGGMMLRVLHILEALSQIGEPTMALQASLTAAPDLLSFRTPWEKEGRRGGRT